MICFINISYILKKIKLKRKEKMRNLKDICFDEIINTIKKEVNFSNLIPEGFEKLEDYIYQIIYIFAKLLLQNIIDEHTNKIGFQKNIKIKYDKKTRIYSSKQKTSTLIVNSLFGEIKLPYKNYYNKTTKTSVKVNCLNYKENDSVSPNVKKKIIELTPFDYYEDANIKLYKLANLNLSTSTIKRVTNSLGKENINWINNKIEIKNQEMYSANIIEQSKRIVISNDGGRFRAINFTEKGRAAPKNPKWKEAKAGVVFEIDDAGKKTEKVYYYGKFDAKWQALGAHLIDATNRFGIQYCRQFETLSDCGNGIKQMYEREFNMPDNKVYFDASDYYHTTEYLWELGKKIFPNNEDNEITTKACEIWVKKCIDILLKEGGKKLLKFFKLESYDNKLLKKNYD